jgi:hypothetical protein
MFQSSEPRLRVPTAISVFICFHLFRDIPLTRTPLIAALAK